MASSRDGRLISPESLERLRETVIELFAAGSFDAVGMRAIASQAGVGPATIYKYFGTKEELIFACIQPEITELGRRLVVASQTCSEAHTRERFGRFADTLIGFYIEHRQVGEIVYLTISARNWIENTRFIQTQQLGVGAEILRQGQARGEVRGDVPPELLVELLAGAVHRYMMRLMLTPGEHDPLAHSRRLQTIFWPMLQAP
jgi:AcrR family transcriptional regulator